MNARQGLQKRRNSRSLLFAQSDQLSTGPITVSISQVGLFTLGICGEHSASVQAYGDVELSPRTGSDVDVDITRPSKARLLV
jgi:hypothetical protein